ncbi:hypothetical protein L1887_46189 [Cichorium endivia]|nr:hypothetical protein L1887_46189 [Cichorium endivia]
MPAAMPGIAGQSALTLRNGSEGSAIKPIPYENLMEHHRETAQNPEKHVGQLLQHVQRRAARRHVLIKKPASAENPMSQNLSADQELVSDVVACQLVIKQILDVLDVIAPVEVREKMSTQLKNIDFASHPAAADPVTLRAIQKAIALIELRFTPQGESH